MAITVVEVVSGGASFAFSGALPGDAAVAIIRVAIDDPMTANVITTGWTQQTFDGETLTCWRNLSFGESSHSFSAVGCAITGVVAAVSRRWSQRYR